MKPQEKINASEEGFRGWPRVYKGKMGNGKMSLVVIYQDHSEYYELTNKYDGEPDCPYDPHSEIEMAKGGGMEEVHCGKEYRFIKSTELKIVRGA